MKIILPTIIIVLLAISTQSFAFSLLLNSYNNDSFSIGYQILVFFTKFNFQIALFISAIVFYFVGYVFTIRKLIYLGIFTALSYIVALPGVYGIYVFFKTDLMLGNLMEYTWYIFKHNVVTFLYGNILGYKPGVEFYTDIGLYVFAGFMTLFALIVLQIIFVFWVIPKILNKIF